MKKRLWRIIIAAGILLVAIIMEENIRWYPTVLFIISYLIAGSPVLLKAIRNIFKGKVFDENFLMSLATVGAFIIGEYPEAVAVMLFYEIGELFQSYAVDKSRKSIADLMDIRPDYANVKYGDEIVKKDPDEVKTEDIIVIKAGERIPLDCRILEGSSMVDTSALTGESVPREVNAGDDILSGCINVNGTLTAVVTKEYGESTVSKILDLVENASSKKSKSENFITKFARIYTPIVVIIAVLLAVLPPLIMDGAEFRDWIYRSFSFLVVSCPCALVVSIPLSFFGGLGRASKKGILIKGSNYLEALANTEIVVFDKTGTLTKGVFNVQEIHAEGTTEDELLKLAAYAEAYSNHPISTSLKAAYGKDINYEDILDTKELSGYGVTAIVNGRKVAVGNTKLMDSMGYQYADTDFTGSIVHVAVEGKYAGYIIISDEVKKDSLQAVADLKAAGIKKTVMLTGDTQKSGQKIAGLLSLDEVYCELLPSDKVAKVEELIEQKSVKGKLAFVGDGINDAPVLARADLGIAMGGLGSDAAIEAADIVLMTDEPSKLTTAMKIAKKTLKIAKQNIVFAIGIKIIVLILSAFGLTSMWAAVFADVGVTVIAVLNSLRAM